MNRIRYFTETLPAHEDPHHPSQRSELHRLDVAKSSWVRIDDQTIMGYAELSSMTFHKLLSDHETIVIHPSVYEKKTLHEHLSKKNQGKHLKHHDALANYCGVTKTDTTMDVIGKMIEKGHSFLHADL